MSRCRRFLFDLFGELVVRAQVIQRLQSTMTVVVPEYRTGSWLCLHDLPEICQGGLKRGMDAQWAAQLVRAGNASVPCPPWPSRSPPPPAPIFVRRLADHSPLP